MKNVLAREVGFEPTTFRLTAERSTTELLPNNNVIELTAERAMAAVSPKLREE